MRLADRPIQTRSGPDALSYGTVPVVECGEGMVRVSDRGIAAVPWYALDGGNPPYNHAIVGAPAEVWARVGVVERLVAVDAVVAALGFRLLVYDAWRPIACQRGLWDHFWAQAMAADPDGGPAAWRAHTGRYVSDPTRFDPADSTTWPTHCTGGAVDLTLTANGAPVDMGTPFDDATERSHAAALELEDTPARAHRRVLHHAMVGAGFVAYTYEWWHFDFGTQLGVAGGAPGPAIYGPVADVSVRPERSRALAFPASGLHR